MILFLRNDDLPFDKGMGCSFVAGCFSENQIPSL